MMTKLVFGTYSYVEHDLTGAVKRFKVVLELQEKKRNEQDWEQKVESEIIREKVPTDVVNESEVAPELVA